MRPRNTDRQTDRQRTVQNVYFKIKRERNIKVQKANIGLIINQERCGWCCPGHGWVNASIVFEFKKFSDFV